MTDSVRLRHRHTGEVRDVPAAAVPFFPDYEPVDSAGSKPQHTRTAGKAGQSKEDATDGR